MDLQQGLFIFVGAVIMMIICPALMLAMTITLDSIKPKLGFDLAKLVSPAVDLFFMPFLVGARVFDTITVGFKNKSHKEQEAYWQAEYKKAGY
jgi:hypothetical protein